MSNQPALEQALVQAVQRFSVAMATEEGFLRWLHEEGERRENDERIHDEV